MNNLENFLDIECVNIHVKAVDDFVEDGRKQSGGDAGPRRTQLTTGYGLNEPQWTIGFDVPPLIHSRSPYARVPLPPLFKIHPILAFREQPALDWTIDLSPDDAVIAVGYTHLDPYHWKAAPATDPPTSDPMVIYLECLNFYVTVKPGGTVLTVGDVLMALYIGGRRCVTERMLAHVGLDVGIMEGYHRLVEEIPLVRGIKTGEDEVCSNVRLSANFWTKWVGLAPSGKDDDTWSLYTKHLAS